MIRAITTAAVAFALTLCVGHEAQAQCKCPKGKILACISPNGGFVYTTPQGGAGHSSIPAPTLVAGMTYVLKPDAEKAAYLQSLSSQDQQLILANISTIKASVQDLQASHAMYLQEVRAKGMAAPQIEKMNGNRVKIMNKVGAPN